MGEHPVLVEPVQDGLVVWERALDIVKNIVVILTCLVFLYLVWRGYVALQDLAEQLQEWQKQLEAFTG